MEDSGGGQKRFSFHPPRSGGNLPQMPPLARARMRPLSHSHSQYRRDGVRVTKGSISAAVSVKTRTLSKSSSFSLQSHYELQAL